jgi:hypothetical protein
LTVVGRPERMLDVDFAACKNWKRGIREVGKIVQVEVWKGLRFCRLQMLAKVEFVEKKKTIVGD